eukprot:TRINITY_DN6763_c0_g1_i1.p1 TRINITY_DN6763_c0_g1~~TRINITY_DN6763_c0_g1_i1.p1  ORF type:complete len:427 (+),score=60.05 TRINITY_DN6763_c0_g1_i1:206-1486(+)
MHASPYLALPWLLSEILRCVCHRKSYNLMDVDSTPKPYIPSIVGSLDECKAGFVHKNTCKFKNSTISDLCDKRFGVYCNWNNKEEHCCCSPDRVSNGLMGFRKSAQADCTQDPLCPKDFMHLLSGHDDLCVPSADIKETELDTGDGGRILLAKRMEKPRDIAVKISEGTQIPSAEKECNIMKGRKFKELEERKSVLKMFACGSEVVAGTAAGQKVHRKLFLIFMERGGSFLNKIAQLVEKGGGLKNHETVMLSYMRKMAAAVADIHSLELAHRDINLDNFVLADQQQEDVRIIDFGFAEDLNAISEQDKHVRVGAPLTRAPECWNENRPSTEADVWSLGLTFLHMIFAKFPCDKKCFEYWRTRDGFRKEAHLGLATYILQNKGVTISDYSPDLLNLLDGMIVFKPEERLTMEVVKEKLSDLQKLQA